MKCRVFRALKPTRPYLKGKEKNLFPDLQRICSHWTRRTSAESSNLSTMSWKTQAEGRSQYREGGQGSSQKMESAAASPNQVRDEFVAGSF